MDARCARTKLAKLEAGLSAAQSRARGRRIAIQEAGRNKAKVQAETARRNIEMMTLKAPADGYLNVERNTNTNFFYSGHEFPLYQVGDQVRPGMAVAQIPDLDSWEASAQIAETRSRPPRRRAPGGNPRRRAARASSSRQGQGPGRHDRAPRGIAGSSAS